MSDFLKQIDEDIMDYQDRYPTMQNITKKEWAFNFWILDKLYSVEEDIIEENIVDYNDKGIDCYVWHEDQRDLYLIQNKCYSEGSTLSVDYVQNDFLVRAIGALENGTYTRNAELQKLFSKYCGEPDFSVHFRLYVTNDNSVTPAIIKAVNDFNLKHDKYDAKVYSLSDIEKEYYGEPISEKKNFKFDIITINKGTTLNINPENYKINQPINAKYIFTPIKNLYDMLKKAKSEKYPIFDSNIREYLGAAGAVNKGIVKTLNNPVDRKNFFFYNNGVTIIVKKVDSINSQGAVPFIRIYNPQIVNGCQTVSTIYETLSGYPESSIDVEFADTYVMLKVLEISDDTEDMKALNDLIVTYNNSQNSINQKTFAACASEFKRIQREFERKGFLVCIKQSDKNTYKDKYKAITPLTGLNNDLIQKFGLNDRKNIKDLYIDLEKLLQVILAFSNGAQDAIQNKSKLLNPGSNQNLQVLNFVKSDVTINDILNLYLLYLRAEQEKKASDNGKMPIPFYLIDFFAQFECRSDATNISNVLSTKEDVDRIIKLYKMTISGYYSDWTDNNPGKDYNDMIKSKIDMTMVNKAKKMAETMYKSM